MAFAVRNLAPYRYESHRIPANRLDQIVERKILTHPNCQRLIVISEAARLGYRSLFPGLETPITVAPDGANDPCTQEHEFDVMEDEPGIGYVGHLLFKLPDLDQSAIGPPHKKNYSFATINS